MTDLEVDSASRSLVASWFGLQTSEAGQEIDELPKESVKKIKRKHEDLKDNDKDGHFKRNEKDEKPSLGNFIEKKLNKKLKKSKQRKEEAKREALSELQDSNDNTHKKKKRKQKAAETDHAEEEELSKVTSVLQKANKTEEEGVQTHTIESLQSSLADKTLSKSKRKRLKRKLNTLLEKETNSATQEKQKVVEETNSDTEDGQQNLSDKKMKLSLKGETSGKGSIDSHCHKTNRKRNHDTSTGASNSNHRDRVSSYSDSDVNNKDSSKRLKNSGRNSSSESESVAKTEQKVAFSVRNENYHSTKSSSDISGVLEPDSISVPKRKRKKVRSKQKNIKKDNRPDHLKPAHLRKKTKDEGTEEKDTMLWKK